MIRVIFNFLKYMKQHSFCFFLQNIKMIYHTSESHLSQKKIDEIVSFIDFKILTWI